MKIFHIMNPSPARRKWVEDLTSRGKPVSPWARVTREHPAHTETLVDWALKEEIQRIVVWGGDGTFHRVVRALRERNALDKMELALVPVGTCNDLARRYGISREHWPLWEVAIPQGRLATPAVARLSFSSAENRGGDIFINNAGFGRPRTSFEKKDPPWKVIQSFQAIRVKARWEDGQLQGIYYMVLACLSPYFSGGLHFERHISPEDGLLRLYLVPARSKFRLGLRLLAGRLGFPLADGKITKLNVSKISLETDIPVWPQADGDPPPRAGAHKVDFEVLPERAKLWVP